MPHLIYDGSPYIRVMAIELSEKGLIITLESSLRTAVAGIVFLVFLSYLGWRNLVIALNKLRIPKNLTISFIFFIKYLPIHIRSVSNMLFARESRLIKRRKISYWKILASIASDLMIKSTYQARRFYLGLKARNFDAVFISNNNHEIKTIDIALLVVSIIIALIGYVSVI